MPSNKKPRKKRVYKPLVLPLTIRHNAEADTEMQLAPHTELMKLRQGYGDEGSWHTIVCRLNIGVIAALQNNIDGKDIRAGLDAMLNVRSRFQKSGKWGLSGDNLRDIGEGLVQTDNLQLKLTRKQLNTAIDLVYKEAAIQ
jgi:hypothetical protein